MTLRTRAEIADSLKLEPAPIRDLLSGRRRDLSARMLRAVLTPASWIYALAVRYRNWRYDCRPAKTTRVECPVVSIGNITTGGTGKTPLVAWVARWFREQGRRVSVISRGYGAEDGACNDEALELEQRLPDVPHLQNPDRVAAAKTAIEELETELIVLDDAFQHRRIARDLDIVLIDALAPFGYEHLLPRGLLREPLKGLARADAILLSRADQVDASRRDEIRGLVERFAPNALWGECTHRATHLQNASGKRQELGDLRGAAVGAFCGIGNPDGFAATIEQLVGKPTPLLPFPDHHPYDRDDVERIQEWALALRLEQLVCTHKDLVKLGVDRIGDVPLSALIIELDLLSGEEALSVMLEGLL